MADLMTSSCTYKSLEEKYSGFEVPALKIKIEGSDVINAEGFYLGEMEVNLSLNAVSSVTFSLVDCYDPKNSTFDSKVKSKMVLGKVIEVELGYLSDTTPVFKGYIASVGVNCDSENIISYEVTAMDVRRLMMTNYHHVLHQVKNYSEAFDTVMKPYKKLCSVTTEATSDNLEIPFAQSMSDYDFVMEELIGKGHAEREFFVLVDKAYFRKPRSSTSPIMTLDIQNGLKEIQISQSYLNQKVQVIGYDPTGKKEIKGEITVKAGAKQESVLSEASEIVIVDSNVDTEKKAKDRALAIGGSLKGKSVTGTITCIGIPEIVPGRYIKVEHLDDTVNKEYYITAVKHNFKEDGFCTSFEIGGSK